MDPTQKSFVTTIRWQERSVLPSGGSPPGLVSLRPEPLVPVPRLLAGLAPVAPPELADVAPRLSLLRPRLPVPLPLPPALALLEVVCPVPVPVPLLLLPPVVTPSLISGHTHVTINKDEHWSYVTCSDVIRVMQSDVRVDGNEKIRMTVTCSSCWRHTRHLFLVSDVSGRWPRLWYNLSSSCRNLDLKLVLFHLQDHFKSCCETHPHVLLFSPPPTRRPHKIFFAWFKTYKIATLKSATMPGLVGCNIRYLGSGQGLKGEEKCVTSDRASKADEITQ